MELGNIGPVAKAAVPLSLKGGCSKVISTVASLAIAVLIIVGSFSQFTNPGENNHH